MTELSKGPEVFEITENKALETVLVCVNKDTKLEEVRNRLTGIVRQIKEALTEDRVNKNLQVYLGLAEEISTALRKNARKNDALRYYYFGMYQALIENLQEEHIKKETLAVEHEATSRKHFSRIMQALYAKDFQHLSGLARELKIDKANLSREMEYLILAGFVEQTKSTKFRFYNLSARGYVYYNRFLFEKSSLEPEERTVIISYARSRRPMLDNEIVYHVIPHKSKNQNVFENIDYEDAVIPCKTYMQNLIIAETKTDHLCLDRMYNEYGGVKNV